MATFSCKRVKEAPEPSLNSTTAPKSSAQVQNINGRLHFPDTSAFFRTYEALSNMNGLQRAQWEANLGITSTRAANEAIANDTTQMGALPAVALPTPYESMLNSNSEVQIGDTILFYSHSIRYRIPASQEASLKTNGRFNVGLLTSVPRDSVKVEILPLSLQKSFSVDAPYQMQYNWNGTNFKSVIELVSFQEANTYSIFLRIKHEVGRRRGRWFWATTTWEPSFEWRHQSHQTNYTVRLYNAAGQIVYQTLGTKSHFSLQETQAGFNWDYFIELGRFTYNPPRFPLAYVITGWRYRVQGPMSITARHSGPFVEAPSTWGQFSYIKPYNIQANWNTL